jgi:hypothetical protein
MTSQTGTTRRVRRRAGAVVVDLPRPVMDALIRLAVREDRDVTGQARRLIADGLETRGMLAPEPVR